MSAALLRKNPLPQREIAGRRASPKWPSASDCVRGGYYFLQVTSSKAAHFPSGPRTSRAYVHALSPCLVKVWWKGIRPMALESSPVQTSLSPSHPVALAVSHPSVPPAARTNRFEP